METKEGKTDFDKIIKDFDVQTQKAFLMLRDNYWNCEVFKIKRNMEKGTHNVVIYIADEALSYRLHLILECTEEININCEREWENPVLFKSDGKYILQISEDKEASNIPFVHAKSEIIFLNYEKCTGYVWGKRKYEILWVILAESLRALQIKSNLGMEILNEHERRLLPLANFGPILSFSPFTTKTSSLCTKEQYDLISQYIKDSGFKSLQPYMDKLYCARSPRKKHMIARKIKTELGKKAAFSFWKLIQTDLEQACAQYPSITEYYIDKDRLNIIKSQIENAMRNNGFEGEYPQFSYQNIKEKKSVISSVVCYEYLQGKEIFVSFFISTNIFNKKSVPHKPVEDTRISFFASTEPAKNLQCKMELGLSDEKYEKRDELSYLDAFCNVIRKKVLRLKLTHAERKNPMFVVNKIHENMALWTVISVIVFGLILTLIFTAGFWLISALISLSAVVIFRKPFSILREIVLSPIWWKVFAVFGVITTGIIIFFTVAVLILGVLRERKGTNEQ